MFSRQQSNLSFQIKLIDVLHSYLLSKLIITSLPVSLNIILNKITTHHFINVYFNYQLESLHLLQIRFWQMTDWTHALKENIYLKDLQK